MEWEQLFSVLQVLNPESDQFKLMVEDGVDEDIATERWEDICYYMDTLKPRGEND